MSGNCEKCGGKITGLAHIGIMVKDVEVSKDFYMNKLGFELTNEYALGPNVKLAFLKAGTCILELVQNPSTGTPRTAGPVDHVAVEVENIEALVCKLTEKQIAFESGEISQNDVLFGGVKNIFFAGPDGERIEFFEYLNK